MAVFNINKTSNYTVISNYHLREKGLSLKAKGLLTLMLSLPEDWDYSISGLASICLESEKAIKSGLDELKQFGYLKVTKVLPNKEKGIKTIEYIYDIYEQPIKNKEVEENIEVKNQDPHYVGVDEVGLPEQGVDEVALQNADNKIKNNKIKNNNYIYLYSSPEFKKAYDDYIEMRKSKERYSPNDDYTIILQLKNACKDSEKRAIEILQYNTMGKYCNKIYVPKEDEERTKKTEKPPKNYQKKENNRVELTADKIKKYFGGTS